MTKTKRILKTAGRVFLIAFISLMIGLRFYSWNAKTLAGNDMPMPFGWGASVVLSGSMEPVLSVDDLVFVHEAKSYEKGDIVVYQDGSALVIHEIIAVNGDTVITQGRANNTADEPIKISAIKGKAVAHIPYIGAVVRFIKTPVGFILLIVAALVLFELPYLNERKKAEADKERIKEEIRKLKGE